MNGLVIWAHDNCRSTLAFYLELGRSFMLPTIINIVHKSKNSNREKVGFSKDEIIDSNINFINDDEQKALSSLLKHRSWNHIFASYHKEDLFKTLILKCIDEQITYAIASEAPCNMEATGFRRILKSFYLDFILPHKIKNLVKHADFILNYSGYYQNLLENLGWKNKIISCGYFPPPVPKSCCIKRDERSWFDFTILLSGLHQWHRSPLVLVHALKKLQDRGIDFKCVITQEDPLLNELKKVVQHYKISNVEFLGFVPLEKLIELYQTCSVYIGCGSYEPWGMRLNDVLQCGAPLIVSRGMGGVKLVDDYQCGLAFNKGESSMLAAQLELMITDKEKYLWFAANAYDAALKITPQAKSVEIVKTIQNIYPNWK